MKLGYVQFAPSLCDLDATLGSLARWLPECATADLVVLPELCNSGYNFASIEEVTATAETVSESRFLSFLVDNCRRYGYHVVSGFNERDGDVLYNTAVLVGPNGYLGRYRKLHLFKHEKDFFQSGDLGLPVFHCGPARLGMLICFDWLFPEAWRVLAIQGADIICHPSNLVLPGLAQRAVPIHALTNRFYIVTANRIGTERDLTFTGTSLIADPGGEVLVRAPEHDPHVAIVDIDLERARDKWITPMNHLWHDRRPAQYKMLSADDTGDTALSSASTQ